MNISLRKTLAASAIAGSLLVGGATIASAQSTTAPATTGASATRTAKSQNGGFSAHAPAIAKALGLTTVELDAARQAGKTIATLAKEKGVDLQKIIAAYVAEEQAEHPTMAAADVLKRVTDRVNGVAGNGGPGDGHGRGHHGGKQHGATTTPTTVKV